MEDESIANSTLLPLVVRVVSMGLGIGEFLLFSRGWNTQRTNLQSYLLLHLELVNHQMADD